MMHIVKKVKYIEDFKLLLTFNDKKKKIVDLIKYSNESQETVFYPFKNIEFFKSVEVDEFAGTLVWPNGADLCPDVLYEMGVEVKEEKKKLSKKKTTKKFSSSSATPKPSIAAGNRNHLCN